MKIKFVGSALIVRRVGDVVWDKSNDHVAETSVEMAADLLTLPNQFRLIEANEMEIAELAERLGCTVAEVKSLMPGPQKRVRRTRR